MVAKNNSDFSFSFLKKNLVFLKNIDKIDFSKDIEK